MTNKRPIGDLIIVVTKKKKNLNYCFLKTKFFCLKNEKYRTNIKMERMLG